MSTWWQNGWLKNAANHSANFYISKRAMTQRLLHTHSAAHYSVSAIYYIVIGAVQDKKQKTTLTTLVSDLVTTFSCTKIVKYLFIRIITVVNCELFCQTATYLLLEGKTCCGLKGMNLWTKKMLQYRLASLQPAMNCTMSSALTEAHKDGHKLTCCAIASSILTGALGTILAVTFLSTVLTKRALWTQFTAICAPVSCRHRDIIKTY